MHIENHYCGQWVDLFMSSKLTLPALCVLTTLANFKSDEDGVLHLVFEIAKAKR